MIKTDRLVCTLYMLSTEFLYAQLYFGIYNYRYTQEKTAAG